MELAGGDNNTPKIFRSGDDNTDDIIKKAQEINRRAIEMIENGGKSMYVGPYLRCGMTREKIKRIRSILASTRC